MPVKASTFYALMAEFNTPTVELSQISEKYFGLGAKEAAKRANLNRLPVPVFRCGTQKATWIIHVEDLANLIDQQRQAALREWQKMNG